MYRYCVCKSICLSLRQYPREVNISLIWTIDIISVSVFILFKTNAMAVFCLFVWFSFCMYVLFLFLVVRFVFVFALICFCLNLVTLTK